MIRNKQVLVAVLNWGLGHATRSIPIIHQLITHQNKVTIASDGAALSLLRGEFPSLPYLELPGYDISYPSQSMVWNIVTQLPKLKNAISSEEKVINQWISLNGTDVIISDNRYGCHHPSMQNIFISHQLNLNVPISGIINRLHALLVNKFDDVWIADHENRRLSGDLSDPRWLKKEMSIKYIGPQSRLENKAISPKYDVAAILSGPEPQRTILEKELFKKLTESNLKSILVQGSLNAPKLQSSGQLEILTFADQHQLSEIICSSELVISRSGYSTIMDLSKLGGNALFVPTPGQSEQIYLAKRLSNQKISQYQSQGKIDIAAAWAERGKYQGFG